MSAGPNRAPPTPKEPSERSSRKADVLKDVIRELAEQFRPVMEQSPDGVYLWLDEAHKACNERLAKLFGFTVEEWQATQPFLENFVVEEDRKIFSWDYHIRVAALAVPVTLRFRGLRKDGSTISAETDMIPTSFRGHAVVYPFVRQIAQ